MGLPLSAAGAVQPTVTMPLPAAPGVAVTSVGAPGRAGVVNETLATLACRTPASSSAVKYTT